MEIQSVEFNGSADPECDTSRCYQRSPDFVATHLHSVGTAQYMKLRATLKLHAAFAMLQPVALGVPAADWGMPWQPR